MGAPLRDPWYWEMMDEETHPRNPTNNPTFESVLNA
jgi:hypothetical protein